MLAGDDYLDPYGVQQVETRFRVHAVLRALEDLESQEFLRSDSHVRLLIAALRSPRLSRLPPLGPAHQPGLFVRHSC
jgi:hypothetical protein